MRLTATVCLALACLAGHGREIELPSDLEGWADWVLDGEAHRDCPFAYNSDAADRDDYICAWPGRLDLLVTAEGARFDHSWTVYGDVQWVVLPGDVNTWPEQVAVNERGAVVVLRNGAPSLRLVPGRHRIRGMFAWDERPPTLAIPSAIGLLALTRDSYWLGRCG